MGKKRQKQQFLSKRNVRMKRKSRRQQKGAPRWMVTYSDMITLILVFFILLFSMSQIDMQKFEMITESFQDRAILDFLPSTVPTEDLAPTNGHEVDLGKEPQDSLDANGLMDHLEEWEQKEDALAKLMEDVEVFLEKEGLTDGITANRTEEGVVLVLQDSILFRPAEAEVLESGELFLNEVGTLLKEIPNKVRVEGHTDTRPISNYQYPSNWELSGARASSVIRYLLDHFDLEEQRFSLAGYGEMKPVAKNDTPENMAKNRRVEIIILDRQVEEE